MALDSNAQIQIVTTMLRRKYTADVVGLKRLWEKVATEATEYVEITGNSYEGGSASGSVVFERLAYLAALEAALTELDPAGTPTPPPSGTFADFSHGFLQT